MGGLFDVGAAHPFFLLHSETLSPHPALALSLLCFHFPLSLFVSSSGLVD